MEFRVAEEVLKLGIKVIAITIKDMKNTLENNDFNRYKLDTLKELRKNLSQTCIENDPSLNSFWQLHECIGKIDKQDPPSPVNLLTTILTTEGLPNINLIVDIYNVISAKTKLSIGAHDMRKINGTVALKIIEGSEIFLPIDYSNEKVVNKGEYAYIDEENDVLCRMDIKQSEKTKVTEDTTDCLYIIQGTEYTDVEKIEETAKELIDLTTKYCGGRAQIIYKS